MNETWNSRTRVVVDGAAFKTARIMFKTTEKYIEEKKNHKRGEPLPGSQKWLAKKSSCSPRAISSLEHGKASISTVDSVSKVLRIKGRQYILGYGREFTTVRATGVIDFRPGINGRIPGNETSYLNEPFLVTIDPILIKIEDESIEKSVLKEMKIKLSTSDMEIDLDWLYNVCLTDRSKTWLGDEEGVNEVNIYTKNPYKASVMFNQDFLKALSWGDFIERIKETKDGRILLTLILTFEHFEKESHIIVSVEELKALFAKGFPHEYPYWTQPKALMV